MSDYGWFCVKQLGFYTLIGTAVWLTSNGWCLLALLLTTQYTLADPEKDAKHV